jgi:predicted transcriptional regulator of viral defense system
MSAFSFHHLTDQLGNIIYVMAPLEPQKAYSKNLFKIDGVRYHIIRVKKEHFFGFEQKWIGRELITITDLERTLIDGLVRPKYCGGFREVLDAYSQAIDGLDVPKIISYARKISDSACKRLGWVLNSLGVDDKQLQPLLERTTTSFAKLNPSGPQRGSWNKKWLLLENL